MDTNARTELGYKYFYQQYRYAAKARSIPFRLSFEEFRSIIIRNCAYCDAPPRLRKSNKSIKRRKILPPYNGVDRVKNYLGYTVKNCVPACGKCNRMKARSSVKQFLLLVKKIYEKHKAYFESPTKNKD
jgi:hypothetical protein